MQGARRIAAWTLLAMSGCLVAPGSAPAQRTSPGSLALELSGSPAGILRAASGGHAVGDVVTSPSSDAFPKKHVGAVRYEDLVLEVGTGMEPSVYQWIASSWEGKATRTPVAVLAASYNLQVVSRTEFHNALIAETSLPTLDAASKEPAFFTLRIAPEYAKLGKGGGSLPSTLAAKTQRPWLANSFRLEIPGLDCSRVRKIDGFKVRTAIRSNSVGKERPTEMEPGSIGVSNLVVTMPETSAETWYAWMKSFLVEGNSGDDQEKNGDLVLLGPDGQSEIARIHLFGLGLVSLAPTGGEGASPMRSLVATLYCERAALDWKGGAPTVMNVRVFGR